MTASFEFGIKKNGQTVPRHFYSDKPPTHHQDIGVVVPAGKPRGQVVMDQGRANLAMTVGGDAHPDPGTAHQYTPCRAALADRRGKRIGKIRIVHRIRPVGPKIKDRKSALFQILHEGLLELDRTVIGGNDNGF